MEPNEIISSAAWNIVYCKPCIHHYIGNTTVFPLPSPSFSFSSILSHCGCTISRKCRCLSMLCKLNHKLFCVKECRSGWGQQGRVGCNCCIHPLGVSHKLQGRMGRAGALVGGWVSECEPPSNLAMRRVAWGGGVSIGGHMAAHSAACPRCTSLVICAADSTEVQRYTPHRSSSNGLFLVLMVRAVM